MKKITKRIAAKNNTLHKLVKKYGSDKIKSGYVDFYNHLFEPTRDEVKTVLEIGIGTTVPHAKSSMYDYSINNSYKPGASLRAWRDYFPNAHIYGGDIQLDTQFQEEHITTFLFDSRNGNECETALGDLTFDIIIDDGNHDEMSQVRTMYNLIRRVNPGGFYIIEDITPGNFTPVYKQVIPFALLSKTDLNTTTHNSELRFTYSQITTNVTVDIYILQPHENLLVLKL